MKKYTMRDFAKLAARTQRERDARPATTDADDSATLGTRRIAGTEFPITRSVRRNGPRSWIVATICNGIAESATTYRTRHEARRDVQRARSAAEASAAILAARI
jgi:hypothetical protein